MKGTLSCEGKGFLPHHTLMHLTLAMSVSVLRKKKFLHQHIQLAYNQNVYYYKNDESFKPHVHMHLLHANLHSFVADDSLTGEG